jgi:hypothetical protein
MQRLHGQEPASEQEAVVAAHHERAAEHMG